MTDRELMQQALEALELVADLTNHDDEVYAAIDALRERLAQPRREWVGLMDREIEEIARYQDEHGSGPWYLAFARAIEAKLKEKNA